MAKYDQIGLEYNRTRKADPFLASRLLHHLAPKPGGRYLDIGCGTGNYTIALHQKGVDFVGIDPSIEMLKKARTKCETIDWQIGWAEKIPLADQGVEGIIASLTLHHWADLNKGFAELTRVAKPYSPIVIFTATPTQMLGYWLNHYFPQMLKDSMVLMPAYDQIAASMDRAGFVMDQTENYAIKPDLQDLFLYSGKHNPSLYFNPQIRQGISSFSSLANAAEVHDGLAQLQADVESREIQKIIKQYENIGGDYLFIVGRKTHS